MSVVSEELDLISSVMLDYQFPWFFSGGWAVDLALEKITRPHNDIFRFLRRGIFKSRVVN